LISAPVNQSAKQRLGIYEFGQVQVQDMGNN
jgi:hypothetical protein